MNEVLCQTSTITIDMMARAGVANQSKYTSSRPTCIRALLMPPYLTPKSMRQTIAAEAGDTIAGMISRLVIKVLPRGIRFKSRAIPSPSRSCSVMDGKMMVKVLIHERQNRLSSSISV